MNKEYKYIFCKFCRKKFSQNKNGLCDNCDAKLIAYKIIKFLFSIICIGSIAMFIIGVIALCGIININLGGAIAMVVIGSILGVLPFIKGRKK